MPQSRSDITFSYAPLVKQVAPAVVSLYVGSSSSGGSSGSGVVVTQDGVIITNDHVVKGTDNVTVVLHDKRRLGGTVILRDPKTDLALVRIDAEGGQFDYLEPSSADRMQVGDLVMAIGNPYGIGQTVTSGIISAKARTGVGGGDYNNFIQTDAAINPGNSGGALINMRGELIGINTAIYSKSGASAGIGFAIPGNMARAVLNSYNKGEEKVVRPWFGAEVINVPQQLIEQLRLDSPKGAYVRGVFRGSSAYKAGMREGDVVTHIDGLEVVDAASMRYRIATYGLGDRIVITVKRAGQMYKVRVTMEGAIENPPRNEIFLKSNHPLKGAVVANISPALAEEYQLTQYGGVVVLKVAKGSVAEQFIKPADILVQIDGMEPRDTRDAQIKMQRTRKNMKLRINRRGKLMDMEIGG